MDICSLWGKTVKGQPERYHPALYHMLDAAHVARALLSAGSPSRWRLVLATTMGLDEADVAAGVPWLVALHDVGKCSQAFQSMVPQQEARLRLAGVPFARRRYSKPHPIISSAALLLDPLVAELPEGLSNVLREVAGGHHGRWLRPGQVAMARKQLRFSEPAFYAEIRAAVSHRLYDLLEIGANWAEPPDLSAAIMTLTGFTILCDWLASDETHFSASEETPLEAYVSLSAARAEEAVAAAGLMAPAQSQAPTRFGALYADLDPRPLQRAVDEIPGDLLSAPSLTVIEAPTGEGKTEAALALAHRIGALRGSDALYYALPTMATSNQMFQRVNKHLREQLGLAVSSKLVHGQAHHVEDDLRLKPLTNGEDAEPPASLEWFGPRKKSLLAPFGVGTIDQAELAVLNVRHVALRCAGLAGKTIILDEVHAYDAYMTTIIERMLTWLRAMGSSVILLSATLPTVRLRRLAQAWGANPASLAQNTGAYPQVLTFSQAQTHSEAPAAYQKTRQVKLTWLAFSEEDAPGKARWLLELAEQGGCACWITNTVAQAQALYRELRVLAPADLPLDLIHSRFPLAQREVIEARIMSRYGPESPDVRRGIVVGTQVLEQSLDLDFDAMVTDLAPVDLLLQRAGRSHRHDRPNRPVATPTLYVNVARDETDSRLLGVNAVLYEEYILQRTLQALELQSALQLPEDYRRLVEAVYSDDEPSDEALLASWRLFQDHVYQAQQEAHLRLVPPPDPEEPFCASIAGLVFQENESSANWGVAQTRLGAESVTLIPLERAGGTCVVPATGQRVPLRQEPDRKTALDLLRQSLRVSHKTVVRLYERPEEQRDKLFGHPLLTYAHPLWLRAGKAPPLAGGSLHLALDPELGLLIDTDRKGGTE